MGRVIGIPVVGHSSVITFGSEMEPQPPWTTIAHLGFFFIPHATGRENIHVGSFQHKLKSCPSQDTAAGGRVTSQELLGFQPWEGGDGKGKNNTWMAQRRGWLRGESGVSLWSEWEQLHSTHVAGLQAVRFLGIFERGRWKSLSRAELFVTPWTIQSMEFSRPEYWSG